MTKNIHVLAFAMIFGLVCAPLGAQTIVAPKGKTKKQNSFAVITDTKTWQHCSKEIVAYQEMLGKEGLPTFVIHSEWNNPEEVKRQLVSLHDTERLEGAVFVGDVPIAMIRKAQHLTSAFKMSETQFEWRDNSVPSDRFYDDFHLQFDFLKRDSAERNFFYYDLAVKSPQQIRCDIYTGRIKPVDNGKNPYRQISDYLTKAVEQHLSGNRLDNFQSYTGQGSYSNSLTAWTPEAFTVREQFPGIFDTSGRAHFMRYSMFDYPKQTIINVLKRDDIDLMIFHEHGTPDRQYVSASPDTEDFRSHIDAVKYYYRDWMRRMVARGKKPAELYAQQASRYGIDSTWMAGWDNAEQTKADSLQDLKTGIVLDDINRINPNTRMVIFDACYNGDFREKDYIAGRYIFADGKTTVCFANSVNVLQDKQANEMLGILGLGARVGQWAQMTNILESHIIGDPTFRFASNDAKVNLASELSLPYSESKELKCLDSPYCDIQNAALHRLFANGYGDISNLLAQKYASSPFAMVRYTSLALLKKLADENFQTTLDLSINDPNEFIRRCSALWMAEVGLDRYVAPIVKEYVENHYSERETFDISMRIRCFGEKAFRDAIDRCVTGSYVNQREKEQYRKALERDFKDQSRNDSIIFNRDEKPSMRSLMISSLRNVKVAASLDKYLALLKDKSEATRVRWEMLDALAWYDISARKADIAKVAKEIMDDATEDQGLREKAERTYYRLTN